jgi:type VI secretion system secreted protein Hcp
MAESISLTISSNGENIPGDHTVASLDREDTIEVLSLEQPMFVNFDRATLRAGSRRVYSPIKFTKRLDRSTPRLREALVRNAVVAGNFRWFRSNPAGDGTTEQFFTVSFTAGRITRCTLLLPDVQQPASASLPPMEAVELVFDTITWTWEPGGIEFEDEIRSGA